MISLVVGDGEGPFALHTACTLSDLTVAAHPAAAVCAAEVRVERASAPTAVAIAARLRRRCQWVCRAAANIVAAYADDRLAVTRVPLTPDVACARSADGEVLATCARGDRVRVSLVLSGGASMPARPIVVSATPV
jgi:hypothetical protein